MRRDRAAGGCSVTRVRRLWLAALLLWHRPRPSVGVLHRLHRPRDAPHRNAFRMRSKSLRCGGQRVTACARWGLLPPLISDR